jgi:hypothetical protein
VQKFQFAGVFEGFSERAFDKGFAKVDGSYRGAYYFETLRSDVGREVGPDFKRKWEFLLFVEFPTLREEQLCFVVVERESYFFGEVIKCLTGSSHTSIELVGPSGVPFYDDEAVVSCRFDEGVVLVITRAVQLIL